LPVAIVKSEPSFEYEATRLFRMDASASSLLNSCARLLEWMLVTTYKPEKASKTPSPPRRGR
jgi:hypothetical protein